MAFVYFLGWTLLIYCIHRLCHHVPLLKSIHMEHHKYINSNSVGWHWSNLFLVNDNVKSTLDLWITDILPTILFCMITGQWWIFAFMYVWTAFIQESIEHNNSFNVFLLTSGKWHLQHHENSKVNFGFLIPIWDIIFQTYKPIK